MRRTQLSARENHLIPEDRDVISVLVFIANMVVLAVPILNFLSQRDVLNKSISTVTDMFCSRESASWMAEITEAGSILPTISQELPRSSECNDLASLPANESKAPFVSIDRWGAKARPPLLESPILTATADSESEVSAFPGLIVQGEMTYIRA